ncbi:MAG: hypothetical protein IKH38_05750 [Clostridia bacterium]|nr:hypothetical protein [Clostridia bacterium]
MNVIRTEWRGWLRQDALPAESAAAAREAACAGIRAGALLTVALYQDRREVYLYVESLGEERSPETFLGALSPYLLAVPGAPEGRPWARMAPVFWHCEPADAESWRAGPPRERRRGRVAKLRPDGIMAYVHHHYALTWEGLHRGDRYMFISLHEDVLFSYFEEPRSSENLRGEDRPSEALKAWIDADPDSHFIHRPEAHGENFLLLPAVFDVGKEVCACG